MMDDISVAKKLEKIRARRSIIGLGYNNTTVYLDILSDDVDWLIAEIERLNATNEYSSGFNSGYESGADITAKRCAEIANECQVKTEWCLLESAIANAIKMEFNL